MHNILLFIFSGIAFTGLIMLLILCRRYITERDMARAEFDRISGEIQEFWAAHEREKDRIHKANKQRIEELRAEYTSEYRRDALNALAHLAENALKDEVKLDAATHLFNSISPVMLTPLDVLRKSHG